MTELITPRNGSIPHRVARLEADVEALRNKIDRLVLYLFGMFVALMLSIIGTLVTTILY